MGDEERSDSGAARSSLIHCVSDADNSRRGEEGGSEEGRNRPRRAGGGEAMAEDAPAAVTQTDRGCALIALRFLPVHHPSPSPSPSLFHISFSSLLPAFY